MKSCLLILLFIFLAISAYSEVYEVNLEGRKLEVRIPGYFIQDVILSQREDSCLGYQNPKGVLKFIAVYFDRNIRDELKEFLQNSMPELPGMKPLILRVNRFFIYETTKSLREYSCLDLSVTFILPGENTVIEEYTSDVSVSLFQQKFPPDLEKVVIKGFEDCFTRYMERSRQGLMVTREVDKAAINVNPLETPGCYRCFRMKNPKKGFYRTYFDFRDALPDTTVDFKIGHDYNAKHKELSKAYVKFPKDFKEDKIWGFCEGDSFYMNSGRSYLPLVREGDWFVTFARTSEYSQDVTAAAIFGGVFFGIIGASLFGGIAAVSSDPNQTEKFRLDLFNGKLVPFDARDYTVMSSRIVLFLSKVSNPAAKLAVFTDGQQQCEMTPGSYQTIELSCHFESLNIRLVSSTGGETTEEIPVELFKTYVYLLKIGKNHKVDISRIHDEMKNSILKKRTKENTLCRVKLY